MGDLNLEHLVRKLQMLGRKAQPLFQFVSDLVKPESPLVTILSSGENRSILEFLPAGL